MGTDINTRNYNTMSCATRDLMGQAPFSTVAIAVNEVLETIVFCFPQLLRFARQPVVLVSDMLFHVVSISLLPALPVLAAKTMTVPVRDRMDSVQY